MNEPITKLRELAEEMRDAASLYAGWADGCASDARSWADKLASLAGEWAVVPREARLQRYGVQWNGPDQPIAVPMPDGYWTPWHLADGHARDAARYGWLISQHWVQTEADWRLNLKEEGGVEYVAEIGCAIDTAMIEAAERQETNHEPI